MKNLEIEATKANQHFEERLLPKGEGKSENSEPTTDSENPENSKEPVSDEKVSENDSDEKVSGNASDDHDDEAERAEDTVAEPKKDK